MIGIAFAERLAGGHHAPGGLAPDRAFELDLAARPRAGRLAWSVSGSVSADPITDRAAVSGEITREGDVLCYRVVVEGRANLVIVGRKLLRLRAPYASLSMFRGAFREGDREIASIRARVDLRSGWRYCLENLRLSLRGA